MSAPVRVQVLGPVRAWRDGAPVPLRGTTARTVLARLALSAPAVVSTDQLADALWDDDPPLEPAVSLRSIISRLRASLGRDSIVTAGSGYRLESTLVEVDLAEVDLAMGDSALDPDDLARRLSLWDGEALSDVAGTPPFEPERARIAELRARLLDAFHDAMLRSGRATEALADLERDAGNAPFRESTQLLLMRSLAACGRTPDALRVGEEYRRRLVDRTGLDPSSDYQAVTASLLDGIGAGDVAATGPPASRSAATRRPWIPPDTPFVGRESELSDLERLGRQRRLVTVTGPGGVGKTRLVTEFARRLDPETDTAVDMVNLAALERSSTVETAVATAVGIEVSASDTLDALAERLSTAPSVLVLDNCEHVLASARLLVQHLLAEVDDLRIITTSRRRLGLADESLVEIGPLALSASGAIDSPPMRLFLDRVERAAPKLTVAESDLDVAVDICRLVDGLPLALELAAARVAMFGLDGLRQRLADGLGIPGSRVADDDRRQATIESTVEWSLALLSGGARELFDDLSVFPSWFDLHSLERIRTDDEALDAFGEILDSSLVVVDHERPAYRLLEPIRHVARRQISDERRSHVVGRYIAWMRSVIDRVVELWSDDDHGAAQQLVIDHHADLRWTLTHFIDQRDADSHGHFANALARALVERSDSELTDLCRAEVGPCLEGDLARCMLAWNQGDLETSAQLVEDIRERIDRRSPYWSYFHWISAAVHLYSGDVDSLAEAAAVAAADERAYPAMRSEAVALWALGLLYSGRPYDAAAVLAANEHVLGLSDVGGFVSYTRAEVIADRDPDRALEYLASAAREADAASSTFNQRLTDVSRLVLLVSAGQDREAAEVALRLVPELIKAGTYPQAWTAMRHVAALLGRLGSPAQGLAILDSADADPGAPAVTGDSVDAERRLRRNLVDDARSGAADRRRLGLPALWKETEPILVAARPTGPHAG